MALLKFYEFLNENHAGKIELLELYQSRKKEIEDQLTKAKHHEKEKLKAELEKVKDKIKKEKDKVA